MFSKKAAVSWVDQLDRRVHALENPPAPTPNSIAIAKTIGIIMDPGPGTDICPRCGMQRNIGSSHYCNYGNYGAGASFPDTPDFNDSYFPYGTDVPPVSLPSPIYAIGPSYPASFTNPDGYFPSDKDKELNDASTLAVQEKLDSIYAMLESINERLGAVEGAVM